MRWLVRGDIDGFFGLALDNLVQLLLIGALCRYVVGLPDDLVTGAILPGAALSILVGNLFYAWQAHRLAAATGRTDVCALPYGINTVSLFAHVFLVMLPAKAIAEAAGDPDPARAAWQAGLWACMGSGLVELAGAFIADRVRRVTPRAALLSTLAGIALTFIALGFLLRTFARPVVGLVTLGVVLMTYFGRVRFRGNLPGGMVAVLLGTALAWATGIAPVGERPDGGLGLHLPSFSLGGLLADGGRSLWMYLPVIVPMGLFNLVGSLQNIESAEAAGDPYPTRPSLVVNGLGSVVAALFGSCFPTTIYIGHPGWKALGARAGYSTLNGVFIAAICLTGTLGTIAWAVPVEAGMAIVLWIGIVITAQAFEATPRHHAPAVVIGLLPGVAAWGTLLVKGALRVAGMGTPDRPFTPELLYAFVKGSDTWIAGGFALEQGFIFTSMVLASATVGIIERQWRSAAAWCFLAAGLSATGIMHGYSFSFADTNMSLSLGLTEFSIGYAVMGLLMLAAPYVTRPGEGH